jgi:hypothetical protein
MRGSGCNSGGGLFFTIAYWSDFRGSGRLNRLAFQAWLQSVGLLVEPSV